MPSRRKLINQVVTRSLGFGQKISGGATSAHVSGIIDRLQVPTSALGSLSALIVGSAISLSIADTAPYTIVLLHSDLTDIATFSGFNTATVSLIIGGSLSTDATCGGNVWDIAGARRYLATQVTVTAATTISAVITVSFTMGDSQIEP